MNIQEAVEYLEGGRFENCSGQIVARHEEKRLDHIVCDLTCACSEVMSKNADEAGEVLVTLLNGAMAVPALLEAIETTYEALNRRWGHADAQYDPDMLHLIQVLHGAKTTLS